MRNPNVQSFMTDKTLYCTSLRVVHIFQEFVHKIFDFQLTCISNNLKLLQEGNFKARNNLLYQWRGYFNKLSLYKKTLLPETSKQKKQPSFPHGTNFYWKSLAKLRRDYWEYQGYTEQNQEIDSEDIDVWWKVYKSILSEYMYTPLELAVQLDSRVVHTIANFHASKPTRDGTRKNNKYAIYYGNVKL